MSWGNLFKRANSYAQAKAQTTLDERTDPKVQLEQAIRELQAHHRDLEAAASHVIAQDKLAKMRLAELSTQEARYTKSAVAAQQQGNLDAARTFATKIAGLRDQIQGLSTQIPQLEAAAADARQAVQESSFQLQQKVSERTTIRAQIDQTRMQQEMAQSMKAVSDLSGGSNVPTFDEIRQKVAGQFAEASAQTELSSGSPEVQEMHVHHAELTSEADAILAELSAGTAQAAPAIGSGAPADQELAAPAAGAEDEATTTP
jgi:phage shock protein A